VASPFSAQWAAVTTWVASTIEPEQREMEVKDSASNDADHGACAGVDTTPPPIEEVLALGAACAGPARADATTNTTTTEMPLHIFATLPTNSWSRSHLY